MVVIIDNKDGRAWMMDGLLEGTVDGEHVNIWRETSLNQGYLYTDDLGYVPLGANDVLNYGKDAVGTFKRVPYGGCSLVIDGHIVMAGTTKTMIKVIVDKANESIDKINDISDELRTLLSCEDLSRYY